MIFVPPSFFQGRRLRLCFNGVDAPAHHACIAPRCKQLNYTDEAVWCIPVEMTTVTYWWCDAVLSRFCFTDQQLSDALLRQLQLQLAHCKHHSLSHACHLSHAYFVLKVFLISQARGLAISGLGLAAANLFLSLLLLEPAVICMPKSVTRYLTWPSTA